MSMKAMAWAIDQQCGSPSAKVTLWSIANHAGAETWLTWSAQSYFVEETEQSADSVQRRMPDLIERGLIKRLPLRYEGRRSTDLIILKPSPYWAATIEEIETLLPRGLSVDPKFASTYVPADCGHVEPPQDAATEQPHTLPQPAENVAAMVRQHEPGKEPGKPEDERDARAREGAEGDHVPHADLLAALKARAVRVAHDSPVAIEAAWRKLTPAERREAVERYADWLADAGGVRKAVAGLPAYLGEKRWMLLPPKAGTPAGRFVAKAFSLDWWIIWHKRAAAGKALGPMVDQARRGLDWGADPEPSEAEREAFTKVFVGSAEWDRLCQRMLARWGVSPPKPDIVEWVSAPTELLGEDIAAEAERAVG